MKRLDDGMAGESSERDSATEKTGRWREKSCVGRRVDVGLQVSFAVWPSFAAVLSRELQGRRARPRTEASQHALHRKERKCELAT